MPNELPINRIICGDCLEVMKGWPDNTVDSIVTDPPAGISFMGKKWDTFDRQMFGRKGAEGDNDPKVKKNFEILPRYGNADLQGFQDFICTVFMEAIRVLKPGGHALVWAIPRTSHHTAMGLERAGFEIRDCVYHIFGSGFPKSESISLALDKKACREQLEKKLGRRPTEDEFKKAWAGFRAVVGKRTDRAAMLKCDIRGGRLVGGDRPRIDLSAVTAPATPDAKQWDGWGTALKPAVECWWLCRKPISEKTIAKNVLRWGVGGLNIDACRIETEDMLSFGSRELGTGVCYGKCKPTTEGIQNPQGRFPAHLIHDGSEEVLAGFPETNGQHGYVDDGQRTRANCYGEFGKNGVGFEPRGDTGSAARFFYCAKASKEERNVGCEGIEQRRRDDSRKEGNPGGDNPRNRGVRAVRNNHPTVKPVALMEYLVGLITPPNGIVLDMFAGSGTTCIAARGLKMRYIGIETDAEYCKIAEKRLAGTIPAFRLKSISDEEQKRGQKSLFEE